MSTANLNGRRRPTLGEQIDRLDAILDGLADALNESVADAVRETVGRAVQAALTELLTDPALPARLQAGAALVLNWVWEMAQMRSLAETAERPWRATLWPCTIASLGDALATLAVCGVGALAAGQVWWAASGRWNVYAAAALLGGAWAAAFE